MFSKRDEEGDSFGHLNADRAGMGQLIMGPIEITGFAQNYAWGKKGRDSLVAQLIDQTESDRNFAELWYGSHPNGCSELIINNKLTPLNETLGDHAEELLGASLRKQFGDNLPFLFKILSVGGALSIQLHPTKEQAVNLNKQKPDLYRDSNHKPEIAIALTPLTMFYGFRPFPELEANIRGTPELRHLISESRISNFINSDSKDAAQIALKDLYRELMGSTLSEHGRSKLAIACSELVARCSVPSQNTLEANLVVNLAKSYPTDVGLFAPYLMNIVTIPVGEAIYTEPCVPHAHLSGDMVEVMANSDNVVRAGLTPKTCDVETLADIIDCRMGLPDIVRPSRADNSAFNRYVTAAKEFEVQVLNTNTEVIETTQGKPELLFPIDCDGSVRWSDGNSIKFQKGRAVLIPSFLSEYSVGITKGSLYRIVVPS
jgi:mannose-6-phosphate isomerase